MGGEKKEKKRRRNLCSLNSVDSESLPLLLPTGPNGPLLFLPSCCLHESRYLSPCRSRVPLPLSLWQLSSQTTTVLFIFKPRYKSLSFSNFHCLWNRDSTTPAQTRMVVLALKPRQFLSVKPDGSALSNITTLTNSDRPIPCKPTIVQFQVNRHSTLFSLKHGDKHALWSYDSPPLSSSDSASLSNQASTVLPSQTTVVPLTQIAIINPSQAPLALRSQKPLQTQTVLYSKTTVIPLTHSIPGSDSPSL